MGHKTQDQLMEVGSILLYGENMGLVYGGGQAIMRNDRGYIAGSDSRRDGLAAAY
jgi:gamma-glutamyltranspeptidase / glutathione hydrolase